MHGSFAETIARRGARGVALLFGALAAMSLACGSKPRPAVTTPREAVRVVADAGPAPPEPPPALAPPKPPIAAATGEPVLRTDRERKGITFYAPATIDHRDGRFDLLVHFHGKADRAVASVETAGLHAVLVNVDIGTGSAVYKNAFAPEASLRRIVELAERHLAESGRLKNATVGRMALSAWSAGFGAVREILKRPEDMAQVEALLLADGYYSDWTKSQRAKNPALDKLDDSFSFAHRASRGARLFFLTHTSIEGGGYAGTGDCAAALIQEIGAQLGPPHALTVEAGGPPAYAVDIGSLHIWGFGGTKWDDHVAQHRALGALQYTALKEFWDAE